MPQMYDLYNDKTHDALSKRTNSSMQYEQLVLAPALSYMHDAIAYSETTLDWCQDEKDPPTVEELSEHLEERGLTEGARDHVFDLLDVNRDGEISQSELRESFVKYDDPSLRAALGLGETEADEIFNKIDVNGDGQISREELSTYLADQGHSVETVESVFSAFDDNGDGVISREELHEGYTTYSALRGILGLSSE